MTQTPIGFAEALAVIADALTTTAARSGIASVTLGDGVGRILARDIIAPRDIQPFDNSAMDGFAVRREDLAQASAAAPVALQRTGVIHAGIVDSLPHVAPGCCVQIMTGAPLPDGADAVVPIEAVVQDGDMIRFAAPPDDGAFVRRRGADFKAGSLALRAGTRLSALHILPLASLGIAEISVYDKPRILFLATGDELIDQPGAALKMGQIYDANSPYAQAWFQARGAQCDLARIDDDQANFVQLARRAMGQYDLILSSGAVSAGARDFVKAGLVEAGARILYHKIRMRPGRPNLLAQFPDGGLYFGLPGNPVSTAVGLRFFVEAAVRALTGQMPERSVQMRAHNGFAKATGAHMMLKGHYVPGADGSLAVAFAPGQESFMVSPFLDMDCWISLPEDQGTVAPGDLVDVYSALPGA